MYLLFILFMPLFSWGKFLVEPSYNYYQARFSAGEESGSFTGEVYGLNLGYLGDYFMAGVTLEKGIYTYDSNVTSTGDTKFDGGGVGTFLGFHLLDKFKIWTGYLNSTLEPVSKSDKRYFGQHFSYGLGYRIYNGLMINIYEFKNQFTQLEDDSTGKTTGLTPTLKTTGLIYSLSYIFIF